ncbi:unnamed protein product [Rangifer tarandus platyrhynchus]|uniref:Uncharacterized protein n=2 Tax=Rangifer tarandus platyrhynchus TaxID=3082113 RepID=A0AC59YFZ4_RANTA|nr:unnamed protein product [Rangifer tarandus platyrhynchus]
MRLVLRSCGFYFGPKKISEVLTPSISECSLGHRRFAEECTGVVCVLSCIRKAPLSMEFFRQEYWSGLPFPSLGDLTTQGLNPHFLCLLHCKRILYPLSHRGSPL